MHETHCKGRMVPTNFFWLFSFAICVFLSNKVRIFTSEKVSKCTLLILQLKPIWSFLHIATLHSYKSIKEESYRKLWLENVSSLFSISIYDHDVDGKIQIAFIEQLNGSKWNNRHKDLFWGSMRNRNYSKWCFKR